MIQLIDTADLQEGILMGYKKRSSEGAALTGTMQKSARAEAKKQCFPCKYMFLTDNAEDTQIPSD